MVMQAIQMVHYLPGRVRVRLPRVKGNAALAGEVEYTLTALEGIHRVEASPTTGTVLILYEPGRLETLDAGAMAALTGLAETLGLEHGAMDELQHWLHTAAHGTRSATPTALSSNIAALCSTLNTGVIQVTGGWGALRTLVPLTLAFLGVRSLLLTENMPFPAWYDYLWFAFSTFMVLNPPRPMSG